MQINKIIAFIILFAISAMLLAPQSVLAKTAKEQFNNSLQATGQNIGYDTPGTDGDQIISSTIAAMIQIFLSQHYN